MNMNKSRVIHYLLCLVLIFGVLGGLVGDRVALATQEGSNGSFLLPPSQEEPPVEEELKLDCQYSALRGKSGDDFEFEIELRYLGSENKRFDLTVRVPPKWEARIVKEYPEKEIASIELKGGVVYSERLKVKFVPYAWYLPEAGDYVVTFEARAGNMKETIELKAIVTAKYMAALYTATGRLNTKVTAGEDNHLSIILLNTGSAPIENISFLSTKPEGWTITFEPEKVDSVEPDLIQEVDVIIKPPGKTIAGDYAVTIKAMGKEISDDLELRVTVLTPTIWGWVGIIIVLVVIAGLAVMFRQLGRR